MINIFSKNDYIVIITLYLSITFMSISILTYCIYAGIFVATLFLSTFTFIVYSEYNNRRKYIQRKNYVINLYSKIFKKLDFYNKHEKTYIAKLYPSSDLYYLLLHHGMTNENIEICRYPFHYYNEIGLFYTLEFEEIYEKHITNIEEIYDL